MKKLISSLALLVLVTVCSSTPLRSQRAARHPLLLVSLDGFRHDYMALHHPPTLEALAQSGVKADALIPQFPSLTFPNHYSIVTGLRPENHGIVANEIRDAALPGVFSPKNTEVVNDGRWWGGEPIWVTAERQGVRSGTMFWPGSTAVIQGVRPSYYRAFDQSLPNTSRVDQVLAWLDLPESQRPRFFSLYFDITDTVGHESGPESAELKQSVLKVDSDIQYLIDGLKKRKLFDEIDLIFVSDHGMTSLDPKQLIALEKMIDINQVETIGGGALLGVFPKPGFEDSIYQSLRKVQSHFKVFKRDEVPERFHYTQSKRIPPILCLADEHWYMSPKARELTTKGTHGFDNQLESMQGFFVAHGPDFKSDLKVKAFENIHIYSLMTHLLGLKAAKNDGDFEKISEVLR